MKYFSVGGRISAKSVSVWHPFWLPKMVLDGVEEKERERLKKVWELENDGRKTWDEKAPFWADESQWGNDGLVTVQSARWGEFLGTMEGCDRKSSHHIYLFQSDNIQIGKCVAQEASSLVSIYLPSLL